jgi:hypothetical protein
MVFAPGPGRRTNERSAGLDQRKVVGVDCTSSPAQRILLQYEAMMSQIESTTALTATVVRKLSRLGRFMLFLCTAGWAYPHVCTEDMDLTRIQDAHNAGKT